MRPRVRQGHDRRIALEVGLLVRDVGDVDHLLCAARRGQAAFPAVRSNTARAAVTRPMRAGAVQRTARNARRRKRQVAELGLADARRIRQHGLEHRLQLAGRARDDLQHLGGRGLLLQRLGELLFQFGARFATAADARSRLRSGRTKLATVRSALRAFARQGHLDRLMLVVTSRGSGLPENSTLARAVCEPGHTASRAMGRQIPQRVLSRSDGWARCR